MRKYNLFLIKDEYVKSYSNNRIILFKTLKNLYEIKTNVNYSLSIYNQICNVFDKKLLLYYFHNKKAFINDNNLFYLNTQKEESVIKINYSALTLATNNNFSDIFKILKIYNQNIFVCDFLNNDYFWIKEYNHISNINKYN